MLFGANKKPNVQPMASFKLSNMALIEELAMGEEAQTPLHGKERVHQKELKDDSMSEGSLSDDSQ